MITITDINKVIKSADAVGFKITVKDISYILLSMQYEDKRVAYKSIFPKDIPDSEIEEYNSSEKIKFLKTYVESNFANKSEKKETTKSKKPVNISSISEDITFEENKAALIDLLRIIEDKMKIGDIPYKDGIKMQADIRTKLNDKFEVEKTDGAQYIIVETKYNAICEYCRHEIYIPTKEDLMKKYNLIEKPE